MKVVNLTGFTVYIFLLLLAAVYVNYVYTIQYFMYNYVKCYLRFLSVEMPTICAEW